ncbi:MAG: glycine cleavage system protein T [Gammaproteobacteria bacterium]|nr:glycine cleavage system protein T [Gammaproteobacteria bacterium]
MFQLTPHTRIRRSPYFDATVAAGVAGFTTYNYMLLPSGYGDPEGEYWRLRNGVSMWDVAAQRQVEMRGPDAGRLARILAPRDLSRCRAGQGKYVALCNHAGTIINDPIALKLDDDRYWLSIAASNILFWARAIAAERGLDVEVTEPDVSPLAVQGPKAAEVIAAMFGDWTRELKHFHFRRADLGGIAMILARSGWSKQGGFEIYLMDGARGAQLWNMVAEAGRPWGIAAGAPNAVERIESGLLSWGGDTDDATNPFEVRLGQFVDLDFAGADETVGIDALRRIRRHGPARHQLGVILDGDAPAPPHPVWYDIEAGGRKVGDMTCGVWSYRLSSNIGFALIARQIAPGARVEVVRDGRRIGATLTELPFS